MARILTAFAILLSLLLPVWAQQADHASLSSHCLTIRLPPDAGCLHIFRLTDDEGLPSTLWLYEHEEILEWIGSSQVAGLFPFTVVDAAASPDMRYLAVGRVGEGHTWAEIVDMQRLLNGKEYHIIREIMPYPGDLGIVGWEAWGLVIESNIDLTRLNDQGSLEPSSELTPGSLFVYDVEANRFQAAGKK